MSLEIKSLHELDTYINGDNSQPKTCPKCGSRTEFEEIAEDKQQHKCLNCKCEFFLDFEEDEILMK
jgi:predicted nucleic-acid-binding Zn-ribbon protein